MTTVGTFPSAEIGAIDIALGVRQAPRKLTLSLTTISCAMRLALSGTLASSRMISSIFLPATVLPCCATYRLAPAEISRPTAPEVPVIGATMPIFTTSCAEAPATPSVVAAIARQPATRYFWFIECSSFSSVRDFMKRVLDRGEGIELDRIGLTVSFLDPADIDVLHDVAGFRIDRDRAARAFPTHAFHGADERICIGLAAGL